MSEPAHALSVVKSGVKLQILRKETLTESVLSPNVPSPTTGPFGRSAPRTEATFTIAVAVATTFALIVTFVVAPKAKKGIVRVAVEPTAVQFASARAKVEGNWSTTVTS